MSSQVIQGTIQEWEPKEKKIRKDGRIYGACVKEGVKLPVVELLIILQPEEEFS